MIRLPSFRLIQPESIDEAVRVLVDSGPSATVVAGGTGLFPNMKRGTAVHEVVVSLNKIPGMAGVVRSPEGSTWIGAATKLNVLAADQSWAPGQAAAYVASPQIRAVATVGGNLCLETRCTFYDMTEEWREAVGWCMKAGGDICRVAPKSDRCWAVVASDLAPVMVAVEAVIHLIGPDGERRVPAEEFYLNDGLSHTDLRAGEILTGMEIPAVERSGYRKVRRRGVIDFPIAGVAVALRGVDPVTQARIVIGAMAPHPVRASIAEEFMVAKVLSPSVATVVGKLTAKAARPMDNTDLTPRYRRRMVSVTTERLLSELI